MVPFKSHTSMKTWFPFLETVLAQSRQLVLLSVNPQIITRELDFDFWEHEKSKIKIMAVRRQ